jgi:hypothetical protein
MSTRTDYDSPWKDILERYLPDFLAFFFTSAHTDIDWSAGYVWLDKELQQIARDAELGRRYADKLVQVRRRDGDDAWVLIHIEVQGQPEADFAERMFVYHYPVFDRYRRQPVSLAVLADEQEEWRPRGFGYALWDCALDFRFPIAKLAAYASRREELEASANPFATVVLTHLAARETRGNANTRVQLKLSLTRRLYRLGYSRQAVLDLYAFIDWLLALPADLEQQVWETIKGFEEEQGMSYITTAERIGRTEGQRELVLRQLERKCGALDAELRERVDVLDQDRLLSLSDALLDFTGETDLRGWLDREAAS